jgi:hypothetical protein
MVKKYGNTQRGTLSHATFRASATFALFASLSLSK